LISNFAGLNPVLERAGQLDGNQYDIVLDWGYRLRLRSADDPEPPMAGRIVVAQCMDQDAPAPSGARRIEHASKYLGSEPELWMQLAG